MSRRGVLLLAAALIATVALGSFAEAQHPKIAEARATERKSFSDAEIFDGFFKIAFGAELQLVPSADPELVARALLALAADPERAREMGTAGRRRQRELFSGAAMVDSYVRVLEQAVARGQA